MYPKPLLFVLFSLIHACIFYILPSTCILSNNYTDQQSLIAFKSAIEIDPHGILANNWTLHTNFCHWQGVICSKRRQRVTVIHLRNMSLVGPISPHLGNLSFLTVLDLRNNYFHGQVIKELGQLRRLTNLHLSYNKLNGNIPLSLSLCQNLKIIGIMQNGLTGTLPKNLSALPRLQNIILGLNNLSGTIPASFYNTTTLEGLGLEDNQFHGDAFKEISGLHNSMLNVISLGGNHLTGTLPPSLFNISSLGLLSVAGNLFTGVLPNDHGLQLPSLTQLYLNTNSLTGTIPSNLYNASRLTVLSFSYNYFVGTLPFPSTLNSLQILAAVNCQFQGEIPKGVASLKNITVLVLSNNKLRGNIPLTTKGMERLQRLYLDNNELEGHIPEEICLLKNLGVLYLGNNQFSGSIPDCIGNLSSLQQFDLSSNAMTSTIPLSLWNLNLFYLNLASNLLDGSITENIKVSIYLETLDLSVNQLSGNLPTSLGSFQSLTFLDLSWNDFRGSIPESFGKLTALVDMYISNNNLSGSIPESLEAISYLESLNLSYNKLSGEIPTGGPFVNFTALSFIGNQNLCGKIIERPCPSHSNKSRSKQFPLGYIVLIIVVMAIVGVLLYVFSKRRRNNLHQPSDNSLQEHRMISYHELSYATTGFSEANILGSGGFGRVYKGILSNGETVAVKLLNLTIDGAIKSFDAECKVLRTVRHRNLVKVISVCTNPELRALVLEYIPNGSLEKWLYSHNYCLSLLERVSIMLDVSVAMDYLHCGQSEPVIHCDLKPSNVLLDGDMAAHVGDFGIAKILAANQNETQTNTLGTFGYIAPEYGAEGRVSTKGDRYSYGIMLLETFTRKKPTDVMFTEGLSLRQWVHSLISNGIGDIVDENLLDKEAQNRSPKSLQSNLLAILELGLGCSRDSPEQRFEMKDVVIKLNKIKLQLISE